MKFKNIALLAVAALSTLTSCSDFLDKETDTRVSLYNTEQLRLLLGTSYLRGNYAAVCELSTDNLIDENSPSDAGARYNLDSYSRNDDELFAWEDCRSDSGSDSPSEVWEECYHAIAGANAVLEQVAVFEAEGDKSAELQATKGEALLIRAYHHFILANVFCMPYRGELSKADPGIPYITAPETKVFVEYDRGNLYDTYAMIEKDLTEGLPLINDAIYEVPKYHFNKAAANAFAARFYLFKREYDKVVTYADAAFGGAGVDPSPYMSKIWSQGSLRYLSDFGRYYTDTKDQSNFMVIATYSTWWRHFLGYRYLPGREAKRATIQGPGPTWTNCRYSNKSTGEAFAMHPCYYACAFTAGSQEYGTYFGANIAEQFEYTDKIAGIGYCHEVRREFFGEETLLCRAEAKLFLGDIDGCLADLKVWDEARRHYVAPDDRMTPFTKDAIVSFYSVAADKYERNLSRKLDLGERYQDSLYYGIAKPIHIDEVCPSDKYKVTDNILPILQCIQHFRRMETIHTGLRWFDIKRFGLSIDHYIGRYDKVTLQTLDPRYALQIPNEIIAAGIEANKREPAKQTAVEAAVVSKSVQPYYGN